MTQSKNKRLSERIKTMQHDGGARAMARLFWFFQTRLGFSAIYPRQAIHETPEELLDFYDPIGYWIMQLDPNRVNIYARGIQQHFSGRRIIDLGTGAHFPQAKLALDAGATEVVAIEARDEAFEQATQGAKGSVYADRLDLRHDLSFNVTLEQKAEGLVHEIVGTVGSDEGFVACLLDAQARLLADDAVIVPERVATRMIPCTDLDLGPIDKVLSATLVGAGRTEPSKGIQLVFNPPARCRLLDTPVLFEDFLVGKRHPPLKEQVEQSRTHRIIFDHSGLFVGFLLCCRIETILNEAVIDGLDQITSWGNAFLRMSETPRAVSAGECIEVTAHVDAREFAPSYRIKVVFDDGEVWETRWKGPAMTPIMDVDESDGKGG